MSVQNLSSELGSSEERKRDQRIQPISRPALDCSRWVGRISRLRTRRRQLLCARSVGSRARTASSPRQSQGRCRGRFAARLWRQRRSNQVAKLCRSSKRTDRLCQGLSPGVSRWCRHGEGADERQSGEAVRESETSGGGSGAHSSEHGIEAKITREPVWIQGSWRR